jgi:CRP-like cAMP-binding protein
MRGGNSMACVQAGDQPVEILTFPHDEFLQIVKESPITAEALDRIVQSRLEAHHLAMGIKLE